MGVFGKDKDDSKKVEQKPVVPVKKGTDKIDEAKPQSIRNTGFEGPGEKTKDGGTSGNPAEVASTETYKRGSSENDIPGSRQKLVADAFAQMGRQLGEIVPKSSPTELKLAMDKLEEAKVLIDAAVNKQQP